MVSSNVLISVQGGEEVTEQTPFPTCLVRTNLYTSYCFFQSDFVFGAELNAMVNLQIIGSASGIAQVKGKVPPCEMPRVRGKGSASIMRARLVREKDTAEEEAVKDTVEDAVEGDEGHNSKEGDGSDKGHDSADSEDSESEYSEEGDGNTDAEEEESDGNTDVEEEEAMPTPGGGV